VQRSRSDGRSQSCACFTHFLLTPSPDGIGKSLAYLCSVAELVAVRMDRVSVKIDRYLSAPSLANYTR
jgi:hypothetical protein